MAVSVFDLFKIGIGPSSSHTVGPMRAARLFASRLAHEGRLGATRRVTADLYGSLGATGKGHGSDKAVLLGLAGHEPDTVDVDAIPSLLAAMRASLRMACSSCGIASTSTVSGSCPARPSSTALSLPWPLPVAPSEPYSSALTRAVRAMSPSCARRSANMRAARIGPTVCELLGPMPILKRSKTETAIRGI
jgi:hypothetical protein